MARSALIGVIGCFLASAVAAGEEAKLSPRHVSVTGTAIARVQPDTVVWNVTVRRTNRELAAAQAACDEGVRKVLALRGDLELKSEDVQTGYLSVNKVFDRDISGNVTSFRHFEVVRTVTLRQKDTSQFDAVLARLVGAADIEVSHHLESSEFHKMRAQTRLEAVKAARDKAVAMTDLLGGKLGRVLRIAEPRDVSYSPFSYASNMAYSAPRQAEPDEAPGTFAPGAIEVRVSIEVDFEIE
jgi:uncharacterized protein YggE